LIVLAYISGQINCTRWRSQRRSWWRHHDVKINVFYHILFISLAKVM